MYTIQVDSECTHSLPGVFPVFVPDLWRLKEGGKFPFNVYSSHVDTFLFVLCVCACVYMYVQSNLDYPNPFGQLQKSQCSDKQKVQIAEMHG